MDRWLLALVLTIAGAAQLAQHSTFEATLFETGFFASAEARVLSVLVPSLEVLISVLLVAGFLRTAAAGCALFLSSGFACLHTYALLFGAVRCGCLGLDTSAGSGHALMLVFSLLIVVSAVCSILQTPIRLTRRKFPAPSYRSVRAGGGVPVRGSDGGP